MRKTTGAVRKNEGAFAGTDRIWMAPGVLVLFVLVFTLVLTTPWPNSEAAPEEEEEQAGELRMPDLDKSEEMERMLQELRQRSPLPGETVGEPENPDELDLLLTPSTSASTNEAARGEAAEEAAQQEKSRPVLSSSFRAKIVERGPAELHLVGDLVFETRVEEENVLLSPMIIGKPVLGSKLSYAVVTQEAEEATLVPQGLYLFDEEGRQKHFLRVPDTKHLSAVYLSPDKSLLAVDVGIRVNHVLHLYDYPSLFELEKRISYYPDTRLIARAQHDEMVRRNVEAEEAKAEAQAKAEGRRQRKKAAQKSRSRSQSSTRDVFESSPLAWFDGHTLVYRILDLDTARPCSYEPCGVVSIRSYAPDTETERLLCAGTELCDCQLAGLKKSNRGRDGLAQVGMQCTRNITEWRERTNKKTTLTLEVPVQ